MDMPTGNVVVQLNNGMYMGQVVECNDKFLVLNKTTQIWDDVAAANFSNKGVITCDYTTYLPHDKYWFPLNKIKLVYSWDHPLPQYEE